MKNISQTNIYQMQENKHWSILSVLLITMCFSLSAYGQNKPVAAVVINANTGKPVAGVNVQVKDRYSALTTTGINGQFKLSVKASETLIFSNSGFHMLQVLVSNLKDTISLQPNVKTNHVIATAYGESNRRNYAGAIATFDPTVITNVPVMPLNDALAGRLAGVQVLAGTGQPGTESGLFIRSNTSLSLTNTPLYVIDGLPLENFYTGSLNSMDIKSVSILKDANAAIYGARGSNGVVLIETKKGRSKQATVEYNAYAGINANMKNIEMMSPYEFVKYQLELQPTAATNFYLTNPGVGLNHYQGQSGIDWQNQVNTNGLIQSHQLALSGISSQTNYYISTSIFNQNGGLQNTGNSRYQGRLGLQQAINKKVKVAINANYSVNEDNGQLVASPQSDTLSYSTYQMYNVWGFRPITAPNESFDLLNSVQDPQAKDLRVNPWLSLLGTDRKKTQKNLYGNLSLNYLITPNLELNLNGGINTIKSRSMDFYGTANRGGITSPSNSKGINASVLQNHYTNWLTDNTLTFKKNFNQNHYLNIMGGISLQEIKVTDNGLSSQQIPNPQLGFSGMDQGVLPTGTSFVANSKMFSFYGRLNYEYKAKWILSAMFRADGSSKFAEANRWGYFPAISAAWRMDNEQFIKNIKAISHAKLRVGYGLTGNNRISDYLRFTTLRYTAASSYSFNTLLPAMGVAITTLGNPDIQQEMMQQTNVGLDLGLFANRLNVNFDYYRKTSKDLIVNVALPATSGVSSKFVNGGKMLNQGFELNISSINISKNNFTWSSDFNINFNQNKIQSLGGGEQNLYSYMNWSSEFNTPLYLAQVGQSVGAFYGFVWDGVYPYSDFDAVPGGGYQLKANVSDNGSTRANIQPGDIKYRDLNGDLMIDDKDKTLIGRSLPVHTGGFNNTFTYKNFSLDVLLQWSYGNDIFNANRLFFEGNAGAQVNLNQYATYQDRWSATNQQSNLHRAGGAGPTGAYSSRLIEDGSYLRLKTISLTYSLPKELFKRIKLQKLDVFASAQNLFTLTGYSGINPDVAVNYSNLTPGFDYSAYPGFKTMVLGIKTSF